MEKIDVFLTSYKRWELLTMTLDSFFEYNTAPVNNFFIYEDYGYNNFTEEEKFELGSLQKKYPSVTWIVGSNRIGQIKALDILMNNVTTAYYFSLEDDWEFYKKSFIEKSFELLNENPKCIQVWLREQNDTNGHPVVINNNLSMMSRSYKNTWHGFSFNPGLRRFEDYLLIKSYQKYTTFNPRKPWESEIIIGKLYMRLGFFAAILPEGHVRHLGDALGVRS